MLACWHNETPVLIAQVYSTHFVRTAEWLPCPAACSCTMAFSSTDLHYHCFTSVPPPTRGTDWIPWGTRTEGCDGRLSARENCCTSTVRRYGKTLHPNLTAPEYHRQPRRKSLVSKASIVEFTGRPTRSNLTTPEYHSQLPRKSLESSTVETALPCSLTLASPMLLKQRLCRHSSGPDANLSRCTTVEGGA